MKYRVQYCNQQQKTIIEGYRAVRRAIEIELGGMSFYQRGAEAAKDPELREFFAKLAAMEAEHNAELRERYKIDAPDVITGEISLDKVAIYADVEVEDVRDSSALLNVAIRLEERARDYFAEQKATFEEGSNTWRLYAELEAEESEHVDMLITELSRYRSGKPGLL